MTNLQVDFKFLLANQSIPLSVVNLPLCSGRKNLNVLFLIRTELPGSVSSDWLQQYQGYLTYSTRVPYHTYLT